MRVIVKESLVPVSPRPIFNNVYTYRVVDKLLNRTSEDYFKSKPKYKQHQDLIILFGILIMATSSKR